MFENPRRGRKARNFTTNAPKILDLKSSSEQIFSRKLPLGAPASDILYTKYSSDLNLGEGLCIFTSFHFPDSGFYLLNGFDFYFDLF